MIKHTIIQYVCIMAGAEEPCPFLHENLLGDHEGSRRLMRKLIVEVIVTTWNLEDEMFK